VISRPRWESVGRGWGLSGGKRQLIEGDAKTVSCRLIDGDLVVAPSEVLNEGMTGSEDASRPESLKAAHRAKPRFQSAMIGLNPVVRILLRAMHVDGISSSRTRV
jgi:hypothetical protein